MGETDRYQDRLSYYRIDEKRKGLLRTFRPALENALPGILDQFYQFMTDHPSSKAVFTNKDLAKLKSAQAAHWMNIFSCDFNEAYFEASRKIGQVHERSGVTPFLFVGGYSLILNRIFDLIINQCNSDKQKCKDLLRAVTAVTMMDMELSLTSYAAASNASQATMSATDFADQMLDRNVSLSMSVNEVAVGNANMMHALEEVNIQAQGIASAVEEMATGIATISQTGEEVATSAQEAQEEVHQGRATIQETAENMARIAEAVQSASNRVEQLAETSVKIADMVQSIEKIAAQTNLLALNATIEAARAGEAGKGFAVVAGEVKNLSNQTARATDDIRSRIGKLRDEITNIVTTMNDGAQAVSVGQESMTSAVNMISSIAGAIDLTTTKMNEIAGILGEQQQASVEISSGISSIAENAEANVAAIQHSIDATDGVVGLIGEQIASLAEFEVPNKSIRIAKADHIVWKKRLADMLSGHASLNPNELASHFNCRLGKWYYSDAAAKLKSHPSYAALEEPHKIVHECGIESVKRFNAGDKDGALELLKKVDVASKDVVRLLDDLIKA